MLKVQSPEQESRRSLAPEVLCSTSPALILLSCFGFVLGPDRAAAREGGESGAARISGESKPWFEKRLQTFVVHKAGQANQLAELERKTVDPHIWEYFDAGIKGDWG